MTTSKKLCKVLGQKVVGPRGTYAAVKMDVKEKMDPKDIRQFKSVLLHVSIGFMHCGVLTVLRYILFGHLYILSLVAALSSQCSTLSASSYTHLCVGPKTRH